MAKTQVLQKIAVRVCIGKQKSNNLPQLFLFSSLIFYFRKSYGQMLYRLTSGGRLGITLHISKTKSDAPLKLAPKDQHTLIILFAIQPFELLNHFCVCFFVIFIIFCFSSIKKVFFSLQEYLLMRFPLLKLVLLRFPLVKEMV